MKNLEKIRSMDVKELARFLEEITDICYTHDCTGCPMNYGALYCDDEHIEVWLNKEADNG